jgi:hypothetical protein
LTGLHSWNRDVVAPAYAAHKASLNPDQLIQFEEAMKQRCLDDEASKDLTTALSGGRAKIMDRVGNRLSREVSTIL